MTPILSGVNLNIRCINLYQNRREISICSQGNCVHRLISYQLHLSAVGTEMISSDKRSKDISDTLKLPYFVKQMSKQRYGIRVAVTKRLTRF